MIAAALAQVLAQHVFRGLVDHWPMVTVICLCGDEVTADDHRGINRHLAVEELIARHQAEVIQASLEDAWADGHESGFWNGRESAGTGDMGLCGIEHAKANNPYKEGTDA